MLSFSCRERPCCSNRSDCRLVSYDRRFFIIASALILIAALVGGNRSLRAFATRPAKWNVSLPTDDIERITTKGAAIW